MPLTLTTETLLACPICGGTGPFKETYTIPVRLYDDRLAYVLCPDCSGEFHNPMWTRETIAEWYASGSYLEAIGPQNADYPGYQAGKRLQFMERHVDSVARFLELGAGTGHLLRAVAKVYGAETVAIEAEPSRAKICNAPDSVTGTFDLIAAIHSLEHCPRPLETLMDLVGRLAPGGHVVIEAPTVGGYLVKYNESHPIAFTDVAMMKMAELAGLSLVSIGQPGHPAGFLGLYGRTDEQPGR